MASASRTCDINQCKHPCRAICMCCQQYLCRDHLKEHDDLINAQLPLLADQINVLSDQLNNSVLRETSCLTDLNQWRDGAHRAVDQFYETKRRQFEELVEKRRDAQKKELDQMRINLTELLREQDATKEQINWMTESIRFLEQDVNDLQHIHCNIGPLVIDDNLISIPNEIVSQNCLSQTIPNQIMSSTAGSFALVASSQYHESKHQKRSLLFPDRSSTKSVKLTRWEIEQQSTEITDSMRINILNTISTIIDTHEPSQMKVIANDIRNWLDETYGRRWNIEIVDTRNRQPGQAGLASKYLKINETRLGWTVIIFKET